MDGSWWGVLTKHGPLEKGVANHFSILALLLLLLKSKLGTWGFPGGLVVNNLPANAAETGSKILHAEEQLSPCATTTEPKLHDY